MYWHTWSGKCKILLCTFEFEYVGEISNHELFSVAIRWSHAIIYVYGIVQAYELMKRLKLKLGGSFEIQT